MKQMRKADCFHKIHYLNYTWQDKLIGLFLILIKHGWYSSMSFLKAFVWLAVFEGDITLCLSSWSRPFLLNQVFIWNEIPCRWQESDGLNEFLNFHAKLIKYYVITNNLSKSKMNNSRSRLKFSYDTYSRIHTTLKGA